MPSALTDCTRSAAARFVRLMQAAVADGKMLVAQSQANLEQSQARLEKAEAAAISDLQLDPTRLHFDPAAAPLGIGSSADTRRGTYRFPGKADAMDVALKVFRGGHALSGAARDQIVREVRVGSKLHHENLVRIFGIVEVPTHGLVLVMELACGGALRDVLCDRQRYPDIPWDVRLRWLVGIAEGMAQLHSLPQAIIHRDLKTANVLLTSAGADVHKAVAKICDFGLAKASATLRGQSLRGVAASSSPGGIVGTLPWQAPETFRGQYTTKSDTFSFAVVVFEVATRKMPFEGLSEPEIIRVVQKYFDPQEKGVLRQAERGIPIEQQRDEWLQDNPLSERRPDLSLVEAECPEALCTLAQDCWADDPKVRPEFSQCLAKLGTIKLKPTFASSHFKREYELAGRIPITQASQVFASVANFVHMYCQVNGLVSAQHVKHEKAFVQTLSRLVGTQKGVDPLGDAGVSAELLWTSDQELIGMGDAHEKELCSLLNAAIRSDNAELMPTAAVLARSINTLCVVGRAGYTGRVDFPRDGVAFRGTSFDMQHRTFFEPNKKYRVPGFLATSFSEDTARTFAKKNGTAWGRPAVLWVVHVDPRGGADPAYRCKHVNFVTHSLIDGEHEYLFTAYSVFTVRECVWAEGDEISRIEVDAALDNLTEPEDVPLAPWY